MATRLPTPFLPKDLPGLHSNIVNGRSGPNATKQGAVQTGTARAPSGPSVPFNNTPNMNPNVHGARMYGYPREIGEVGPLDVDINNYGPNSSGERALQGRSSKR